MAPVYLDHNASTPVDDRVIEVMTCVMREHYANPSSSEHIAGAAAMAVVSESRETIAQAIGCAPKEIVFTSGATESNALALYGVCRRAVKERRNHLIVSSIEHPSILAMACDLEDDGVEVTRVPVTESGIVCLDELARALSERTALVSVMAANNETGVLQPIDEIGELCEQAGTVLHADFSQAAGYERLELGDRPIHLASFSGHKIYGPRGTGALYVRSRRPRVRLTPLFPGGGQERGLRSGTLNAPGIAGLAEAFAVLREIGIAEAERQRVLRDWLRDGVLEIDGAVLNGDRDQRLPNTLSFSIDGIEPLALMHVLRDEVIFSASSACSTDKVKTSHVLAAMYREETRAEQSFRLGLGRSTSNDDVAQAGQAIVRGVAQLRRRQATFA